MLEKSFVRFIALAISVAAVPDEADAAVTIDISETGSDVILTANGTFDLLGLTGEVPDVSFGLTVSANPTYIGLGTPTSAFSPNTSTGTFYSGLIGPISIGGGGLDGFASLGSGNSFAVVSGQSVIVPSGFISGSEISASLTFAGQTFASLGLTPGQYIFTAPNDSVTVNIGGQMGAVPEPATWAMMLLGFGIIGGSMRIAKRRQKVIVRYA